MPVRTLIVDDSPTIQVLLRSILEADPDIQVVGTASDPHEARAMIKAIPVDVLTLDVEMPGMNGLEFLEKVMRLRPMPVVMISTLTASGTRTSIEALGMGAFSCLPKPRLDDEAAMVNIRETVKQAANSSAAVKRLARISSQPRPEAKVLERRQNEPDLVLIGSSTGGVEALTTVLSRFPADCPPVVIAQHMLPGFTKSLTEHLNRSCQPQVREAMENGILQRGNVYFAPSGQGHTTIEQRGSLKARVRMGSPRNGHMPSVDELFDSAALVKGMSVAAALLTGMGKDGADGLLKLRQGGARTIAQDENSSLIYGMPRAAAELGAADEILPLESIANALLHGDRWRNANVT